MTSVAARPGGELLAVASDDGYIGVWAPAENRVVAAQRSDGFVNRVGWTRDGSHLVATANDGSLLVFSGDGRRLDRTIETKHGGLRTFGVHPTEPLVASVGADGVARLWDASSGEKRADIGASRFEGTSVGLTESAVVCGYRSGWFEAWGYGGENQARGELFAGAVASIGVAPGGRSMVLGGDRGRMIEVIDDGGSFRAGNVWRSQPPKGVSTNTIEFAADGSFVAAYSDDTAHVFSSTKEIAGRSLGTPFWVGRQTPWEQTYIVSAACFVPSTPLVATSHFTGVVTLWGPTYRRASVRFGDDPPKWTDPEGAPIADPAAAFQYLVA
jgi:WD40 repeat protein